jgi:hypothetical protein
MWRLRIAIVSTGLIDEGHDHPTDLNRTVDPDEWIGKAADTAQGGQAEYNSGGFREHVQPGM